MQRLLASKKTVVACAVGANLYPISQYPTVLLNSASAASKSREINETFFEKFVTEAGARGGGLKKSSGTSHLGRARCSSETNYNFWLTESDGRDRAGKHGYPRWE